MDITVDFSDVESFFNEGTSELKDKMNEVGEKAISYAQRTGDYTDQTGKLRKSGEYNVQEDGLELINKAEYASFVESKGFNVLSQAALYAEKELQ